MRAASSLGLQTRMALAALAHAASELLIPAMVLEKVMIGWLTQVMCPS